MTKAIENTQEMSCSLPVDEPNMSIDPSMANAPVASEPISSEPPAEALSTPSAPDQYSDAAPPTLETIVSVRNPQQFGGRKTLSIQVLLSEAATSEAARDELIHVLQPLSCDSGRMQMCYQSENEQLGLILAQLMSSDPVVRNEGRLALEHYILGTPEDPKKDLPLRLGVVATVARIRQLQPENGDAQRLLVNVYRQTPHHSPLGQGIDQLSNRAVILQTVGQANAALRPESLGGEATLLASATSAVLGEGGGFPGMDVALAYTVLPTLIPSSPLLTPEQSERVARTAERVLQGTHLEAIPSEEIVSTVQRFVGEASDQFRQDLRRGLLGLGLRYTDFSGNQFLAHANLATRAADRIAAEIFGAFSPQRGTRGVSANSEASPAGNAASPETVLARAERAPGARPSLSMASDRAKPANSAEFSGGTPTAHPLTTSLAGMQGAASQGTATAFAATGPMNHSGFRSQPSYAIEGPTSEEAPHDGFSGGSHGGERQQDQDQPQSQPDSYFA
jgi:hypothetical protein